MSNKFYSSQQIQELLKQREVLSCTEKYVSFTPAFKKQALDLYLKESLTPRMVFEHFGFPGFIVNSNLPKDALKDWKKRFMTSGEEGLTPKKKGRPKAESPPFFSSSFNELEYLRAKVAYLEEENKTFKLIRAGKYRP